MNKNDDLIVEKAVSLSLIELALGSILHALHVPFSGQFLSLNQGLFLTRSIDMIKNRFVAAKIVLEISIVVSIMKSLSPAGKKLGPMISISMQGFLYMIGILLFGSNLLGQSTGLILLSLWAFVQPFVTYFLIYGPDLVLALNYFIEKLNKHTTVNNETLVQVISVIIGIKLFIALIIPFVFKYTPENILKKYDKLISLKHVKIKRTSSTSTLRGVFQDLTKPFFIISMILMFLFFYLTGDDTAIVFWKILRTFAIAFIIFFFSRSKTVLDLFMKWSKSNKVIARFFELSQKAYLKIVES